MGLESVSGGGINRETHAGIDHSVCPGLIPVYGGWTVSSTEPSEPSRPAGTYAVFDDWSDGLLTNRTATFDYWMFLKYYVAGKVYSLGQDRTVTPSWLYQEDSNPSAKMPEWTIVMGNVTLSAGAITWDETTDGETSVYGTCEVPTHGTYEMDYQFTTDGVGNDMIFFQPIYRNEHNKYYVQIQDSGGSDLRFKKDKAGVSTTFFNVSWTVDSNEHTVQVTRDENGNMEVLLDGVSKGTGTDLWIPSVHRMGIYGYPNGGGSVVEVHRVMAE